MQSAMRRLNEWSATAYFKLEMTPNSETPFALLSPLRGDAAFDHGRAGRLVVHAGGLLGLDVGEGGWPVPAQAMQASPALTPHFLFHPLSPTLGLHRLPWPSQVFDKEHRVALALSTWSLVTLSVSLPRSVKVFLNGELVLSIAAQSPVPVGCASLPEATRARLQQATWDALRKDGPFSLDAQVIASDCL